MGKALVRVYRDLEVYQTAFNSAMAIFEASKKFPVEATIFVDGSDATFFAVSVCKFGRGMAQTAVSGSIYRKIE